MRLKDIFNSEEIYGNRIYVSLDDASFNGLIRANETAAFIIDNLMSEISEDELIEKVKNRYEITEVEANKGVNRIINQLKKLNLIQE